jgi:hypothetical protein
MLVVLPYIGHTRNCYATAGDIPLVCTQSMAAFKGRLHPVLALANAQEHDVECECLHSPMPMCAEMSWLLKTLLWARQVLQWITKR